MHKFLFLLLTSLVLASCSKGPAKVEAKSVEWYKEHRDERNAMRKRCAALPDEEAQQPDCKNASAAAVQSMTGPGSIRVK